MCVSTNRKGSSSLCMRWGNASNWIDIWTWSRRGTSVFYQFQSSMYPKVDWRSCSLTVIMNLWMVRKQVRSSVIPITWDVLPSCLNANILPRTTLLPSSIANCVDSLSIAAIIVMKMDIILAVPWRLKGFWIPPRNNWVYSHGIVFQLWNHWFSSWLWKESWKSI